MEDSDQRDSIMINANYEIFVFTLVILQLVNSILWLFDMLPEQKRVLVFMTTGIGLYLLLDAFRRLYKAPNRKEYFIDLHGWLVFLGSFPIPFMVLVRIVWYRLIIHKFRKSDIRSMSRVVVQQRARSTLYLVLSAGIIVMELASLMILKTEVGHPNANIQNASDALWWIIVTIATVGYGDRYPVTNPGRIVGTFVMLVGVGLFSVITSFIAHSFLASREGKGKMPAVRPTSAKPQDLRAKLEEIEQLLEQQEAALKAGTAELREKLEEIEKLLPYDKTNVKEEEDQTSTRRTG